MFIGQGCSVDDRSAAQADRRAVCAAAAAAGRASSASPVPAVAPEHLSITSPLFPAPRIVQPDNKDTALFILQFVQKTGVHMPPGKWMTLVRLHWDSPSNQ